jgi:hypothetical protein
MISTANQRQSLRSDHSGPQWCLASNDDQSVSCPLMELHVIIRSDKASFSLSGCAIQTFTSFWRLSSIAMDLWHTFHLAGSLSLSNPDVISVAS